MAGAPVRMPSAGAATASRASAAAPPHSSGLVHHLAHQRGPQPGRPGLGPVTAQERDPAPVGPRPEQGQQSRQERERADDRHADDHDGADRNPGEQVDPGQQQPGQRDHHGQPGDHDGPARGMRRGSQGFREGRPGGSFFPFPAQVEQRVVDANRHPDDQHHLGGAGADGQPPAGHREQRDRDHDRAAGQQHGNPRRDQRAEHRDQQDQRDRHRRELSLVEVLAHQRVGGLVSAGVTRLGHDQARMGGLHPGHRGLVRVDRGVRAGVRAGRPERDQGGAAVGRDQGLAAGAERGLDVAGRPGQRCSARDHVGDRPAQLRTLGVGARRVSCRGPDADGLLRRADHVELVQHLLGPAGLPRVVLLLALRAEQLPGDQRGAGQHQPADHHRIRCCALQRAIRSTIGARGPARRRGAARALLAPGLLAQHPRPGRRTSGRGDPHLGQGRVERVAHQASRGRGRLSRAAELN